MTGWNVASAQIDSFDMIEILDVLLLLVSLERNFSANRNRTIQVLRNGTCYNWYGLSKECNITLFVYDTKKKWDTTQLIFMSTRRIPKTLWIVQAVLYRHVFPTA